MREQKAPTEYTAAEMDIALSGDRVDLRTGEILTGDAAWYESVPFKVEPAAATEGQSPQDFTSVEQMNSFLKHVDGRKMRTLRAHEGIFKGERTSVAVERRRSNFTLPQYQIMDKLVSMLDYGNVIIGTVEQVSAGLGIDRTNLTKKLQRLGSLVRYETSRSGMKTGTIKVMINPAYGYKGFRDRVSGSRENAIWDWYLFGSDSMSKPVERELKAG